MIDRREIIDAATRQQLNPHVVEKDFVLGWLLAAIDAHEALSESWIFKGGTCLKKCFFETYRFSEDLDFTLTDPTHLDEDFLHEVFAEIGEWVYEETGIEMPADEQEFDIYQNPRGATSCQGKIGYRGPISPRSGGIPRIKLDLTADERVVLRPARAPVFHPYSDAPEDGIEILAYAYEEAFGEKIRALAERTRPRDLYDVVNLFRNTAARPSPSVLLDVLSQKCAFKGIAVPRFNDLEVHRTTLEETWAPMLGHQLPSLPALDGFWEELPAFFAWLEGGTHAALPAAYVVGAGETVLREHTFRLPVSSRAQAFLEIIRFAAANRLCVDLDYKNETRRIEPYSLRRTKAGSIILHAYDVNKNGHRSYTVSEIAGVRATNRTFVPRYEVELTPHGVVRIAPTNRSATGRVTVGRRRIGSSWRTTGPSYVYECPMCQKRFYRKRQGSRLNPHKTKDGYRCSGRTGIYIETKY